MTTKEFLEKVKNDKKILVLFIVLFLLIFVFTYKAVSFFSTSEDVTNTVIVSEKSLIPEDSIVKENHTKLSSYELNKNQNIDNSADLNGMMNGLNDVQSNNEDSIEKNIPSEQNNSDIVNDRTLSFKEQLLAKRQEFNNRSNNNPTNINLPNPNINTSSNNNYVPSVPQPPKKVVVEEPKKPLRRTKNISSDYGSLFNGKGENKQNNHIKAVIHNEGRKVKAGSYVKIRLSEDLTLNDGTVIPKNTIVTSICDFGNQRVFLNITNILYNGKRHSVKLDAFALDGYKGLYDESVIDKEIAQSAMDEAIQSGSNDVTLPVLGNISLNILKKKLKEQHTILREGEHLNLEFSKN